MPDKTENDEFNGRIALERRRAKLINATVIL
jgi:hypothetical protein